ncbi:MAG: hypothetical protein AAF639_27925 [Chloroflexota bacterium]
MNQDELEHLEQTLEQRKRNLRRLHLQAALWSVAFSSDGERVVSGSQDGTIRIWATSTGSQLSSNMASRMNLLLSTSSPL